MRKYFITASIFALICGSAHAEPERLQSRAEWNTRLGSERSIMMGEFWLPFMQNETGVFYGDYRMMSDNQDAREFNAGLGYREIVEAPLLGKGVAGVHGWFDRRKTAQGSKFNQITGGLEWFGPRLDLKLNAYMPLSDERTYEIPNKNPQGPAFAGNGIVVDTIGRALEEPLAGLDLELGWKLDFLDEYSDSTRLYGGAYYFEGDHTKNIAGWRTRLASDIAPNFQVGARFQRDDERGSQGFLEATIRFPFAAKKSYKRQGIRARLDESPERDIDIVTGEAVTDTGSRVPVINKETGQAQMVIHVDNTAGDGDGSVETPYNTLVAATAAAAQHSIIYVHRGDGTSAGQNQGATLSTKNIQLIGAGSSLVYDSGQFTTANGASVTSSSLLIAAAGNAPVISNINAVSDALTIAASNIKITGLTVDGAMRDGIAVKADGTTLENITIDNVTAQNNRFGIYLYGTNAGAVSALVQNSSFTGNDQHGIAIYDDTDAVFEIDLGGGALGSSGNNVLAGNTLEDLAVEYDGRILAAQNNWWGQATGPDTDNPATGTRPQIYYGAPINDGLVGHWTFDNEWTSNTTAYDRSGKGNNGTLHASQSLSDLTSGQNREALNFTTDRVSAGDINDIDGTTEFTYTGWIKLDGTNTDDDVLFKGDHNTNFPLLIWRDDVVGAGSQSGNINTLSFYVYDGTQSAWISAPSNSLNDTTWHHIAVTYQALDATGLNIYIDGVHQQSGSTALVDFIQPSANQVTLGAPTNNTNYFDGLLDNQAAYIRELSSGEIAELYRMDTSSTIDTGGFLSTEP